MNTNQLQKHYDKLTPRERLAALIEARARDDEAEIVALGRSAPMKAYNVVHHGFLEEAWRIIAEMHMIQMLNFGCAFYMGESACFLLDGRDEAEGGRIDSMLFHLEALANLIVFHDAAWRVFCAKVGIDPDKSLLNLPGSGTYSPGAPIKSGMDTLPELLRTARALASEQPDPAAVEDMAEFYRQKLYERAGEQSGGWG